MVSPALGIQRKIDKIAGMAALTAKWCHQGDQEVWIELMWKGSIGTVRTE